MRRIEAPAYFGPLFLSMCLAAALLVPMASTQAFHAQTQTAPAAGTSVVVRMMEAVNSANDPAGKQYRARVNRAVDAGNGVRIPLGAIAAITLVKSGDGSGWTTQLVSVTINGQPVAVASSSASVTSAAQNAAGNAANAVNSVLGGFGHHVKAPTGVSAVATGQQVILPPGTTLTFVLSQPPTSASSPAAPPAPASQPATVSAPPAANAASGSAGASAGGPVTAMYICVSNPPPTPSDPNHFTQYLTAAFEAPLNTGGAIPVLEPAFSAYLKTTYHYLNATITCQPIWTTEGAQAAQKWIISSYADPRLKRVDTGWRYEQPPLTQGQSGFDPQAQGSGGLDLKQHRLTTYYCVVHALGGTSMLQTDPALANARTYVSSIFQADWGDSAAVSMAYDVYIRDHFVRDLSPSNIGSVLQPRCTANSPALQAMMHQGSLISNKGNRGATPVDWAYTPAQAAEARAAELAAGQTAAHQAPAAASGPIPIGSVKPFIACSTSGGAGIDTYLTGVFQTAYPVRHLPNGGNLVDQSVLNRFYAYLKQKGYNFKPGSNYGCAVGRTEAEAEAAKHQRYYEGGGCSSCGKIVETGWKDE